VSETVNPDMNASFRSENLQLGHDLLVDYRKDETALVELWRVHRKLIT
jgi:hypothetical protein